MVQLGKVHNAFLSKLERSNARDPPPGASAGPGAPARIRKVSEVRSILQKIIEEIEPITGKEKLEDSLVVVPLKQTILAQMEDLIPPLDSKPRLKTIL